VQEDGPYFDRLFEVIFGLIEANLRHTLGDGVALPGLLPEHRAAIPTSRAVLTAYTSPTPPPAQYSTNSPGSVK
jgi:hypothetical protein